MTATEERKDEVDKLYKIASKISNAASVVFWLNVVCSFVMLFSFNESTDSIIRITSITSIMLTLAYTALVSCHDVYFFRKAEDERRKVLLSDALGIKASTRKTSNYYNNSESQSIMRLGMDSYENVFFTKKVVGKMLFGRITGMIMVVILYLIFIGGFIVSLPVSINGFDLFVTITQTVFSAEIVVGTIKMLAYYFGLGKIEYEFYCNLIKNKAQIKEKLEALLLDTIMDYECLKSYCQIATSERIFKKYNKHWSGEWSGLYKET